jgi:OTU domain-containing protein 7
VSRARNELALDFKIVEKDSSKSLPVETAPEYTFTLPDLSIHSADFSEFLEKDLIEKSSLVSLEGAGRLNWWTGVCQKLWPLATTGDGNCLLHAASLGMWGFHDRLLTLRKALHSVLTTSRFSESFYRRWRWQTSQQNEAAGLVLCEEEWANEWETLLRMASTQPRVRHAPGTDREMSGGKKAVPEDDDQPHVYESLEELHILALAHVLHRPIVVVADTMLKDITGEPFAPIPFGGIYLPIECQEECHKSPLCLTYDAAHFSALVAMDKETYADKTPQLPTAIPLTDADGQILPLQFAVDPGPDVVWTRNPDNDFLSSVKHLPDDQKLSLLKTYMDIVQLEERIKELEEADVCSTTITKPAIEVEEVDVVVEEVVPEKAHTLPARLETKTPDENRPFKRNIFHSLRRRFGSLRRSMSKSIRSNLGTLARRGTSFRLRQSLRLRSRKKSTEAKSDIVAPAADQVDANSKAKTIRRTGVTCALLHTDRRHDYQDEMVRNYLNTARVRFLAAQKSKNSTSLRSSASSPTTDSSGATDQVKGDDHYASQCVSSGCLNYGTAATSYLCASCFSDQKQQMMNKCDESFEFQSPGKEPDVCPVSPVDQNNESKLKNPADDESPGDTVTAVQC